MQLVKYNNGNCSITIDNVGTRIIEFEGSMKLDHPLNIDIRVSNQCSFGQRDNGSYVLCSFCHESAKVNGLECDYTALKAKLKGIPPGIELAIGCNKLTHNLMFFLFWCKIKGFICNLTVNQGHIKRDIFDILKCIDMDLIKGLGISYRSSLTWNVPNEILNYENTVFHVIMGIDTINDVIELHNKGVKKLLILGEKDFGANTGQVDIDSLNHQQWKWWINHCIKTFDITSFDNLALEQLKLRRLFSDDNWNKFYQGEHSFYINAVEQTFSRSSRSKEKYNWNDYTISEYFKSINHE